MKLGAGEGMSFSGQSETQTHKDAAWQRGVGLCQGATSLGNTQSWGRVDVHRYGGGQSRTLGLTLCLQREEGRNWKHGAVRDNQGGTGAAHTFLLCVLIPTPKAGLHNHTVAWVTSYPYVESLQFYQKNSLIILLYNFWMHLKLT